jgi:thiamine pyrophosphokinase
VKGIILLNGEPYNNSIPKDKGDIAVCCDGAYIWAKDKVEIDLTIGDFDSLPFIPEKSLVYPSEKNYTDGELAINYLKGKCNKIEIYGGGGKREDHFIGNLSLLYFALKNGIGCTMINENCEIYAAEKLVKGNGEKGQIISIVPFSDILHINMSEGLKYPLNGLTLEKWSTRGISNEILEKNFSFEIDVGTALIFKIRR